MKYKPMSCIKYIAIHCSGDPAGTQKDATDLRRHHRSKGWRDVGYHWIIERDGTIVAGRPEDMRGAHEKRINACSVAVCLIGGAPPLDSVEYKKGLGENNFTEAQFAALADKIFSLSHKFPQAEVLGHRDIEGVAKACPSFDVRDWWAHLKR